MKKSSSQICRIYSCSCVIQLRTKNVINMTSSFNFLPESNIARNKAERQISTHVFCGLCFAQMDMMGQSVYEYSHPCDHDELRECLCSKPTDKDEKRACSFFLRLKCTLTNKGRKVNLKSASYKVSLLSILIVLI